MLIFILIAVINAKKKGAYSLYIVGAVLPLILFVINVMLGLNMRMNWVAYFVILTIGEIAFRIVKNHNKENSSNNTDKKQPKNHKPNGKSIIDDFINNKK